MKLLEAIGNTPLIQIEEYANDSASTVQLYGKMEGNNPAGSVKDRPAYNMIRSAQQRGDIRIGDTLIEATSGNTGIALAMCAQIMGFNMVLVMPESATEERKKTMRAYGAELILTPSEKTIEYSRSLAMEMAEKHGYYLLNQFDNPDNWKAHYQTTGPEIWDATEGNITHFVSAMGTTGTITGVGTFLKEKNPKVQIIGVQPAEGSSIPGIRAWSPEMLPAIFNPDIVDQKIELTRQEAMNGARRLASKEGILAGMSAGGAYAAARQLIEKIENGTVVFIVCDRGDRYLSTDLF